MGSVSFAVGLAVENPTEMNNNPARLIGVICSVESVGLHERTDSCQLGEGRNLVIKAQLEELRTVSVGGEKVSLLDTTNPIYNENGTRPD